MPLAMERSWELGYRLLWFWLHGEEGGVNFLEGRGFAFTVLLMVRRVVFYYG